MGKVKRILSDRRAQAGLITAFLFLFLVTVGLITTHNPGGGPALGQYGYGGGGGAPDTTPPVISEPSIAVSDITADSATVSWTTNEPSTSQVEYWPGSLSPLDPTLVTSHSVTLTDLTPETTYHYKCRSMDAAGNLTVSDEHTFTTLAAPDTTPPVISEPSIAVSDITADSATVSWTTDEPSTSQVEYWITTSSLSTLDPTLVTSHSVTLTDLNPDSTYYYKVMSSDASDNLAISDEYTFTTLPAPAPVNWALIGGIIAAVLAIGGLAWYFLRRRG